MTPEGRSRQGRGWYAFGVSDRPLPVPEVDPGPLCLDLDVIESGGLHVLVGEVDPDELDGEDPEWLVPRARAHDRVLTAWTLHGAVVPLRFGTAATDRDALDGHLRTRAQTLRRALESLGDGVEYTVRVVQRADQARPRDRGPGAGKAYLRARHHQLSGHDRRDLVERVAATVHHHGGRTTVLHSDDPAAERLAALIPRGSAVAAIAAVEALADDTGPRLEIEGPLPAYHFTTTDHNAADRDPTAGSPP